MFRKPNFAFWDSHSRFFWLISITKRVLCSYAKVYEGKKIKKESWQYLVHFRNGANLEKKKKQVLSHNGMGRTILKRQLYSLSISLSILFWKTNRLIKLQAFLHNYWRCNGQASFLTHSSSKISVFSSTPSLPSTKDLWWQNTDSFSRISLHSHQPNKYINK